MNKVTHIFINTPIEGNALEQLNQTANLPGMVAAVGLPDLHVGKGHPIGAAFLTKGLIYPYLVGNDIGCGMSFSQLDLKTHKAKREKIVRQLGSLEDAYEGSLSEIESLLNIPLNQFIHSLGTVGGGNHFIEIQAVESVENENLFKEANLDKSKLCIMIHTGSRGLGESILSEHISKFNSDPLQEGTVEFTKYLAQHDYAINWAKANRICLLKKVCDNLGVDAHTVLDIVHNNITPYPDGFLHRKGAAPSDQGLIVIPGSRGDFSYLVKPLKNEPNLYSLAHGAGRKWKRGESKGRLSSKYSAEDLLITDLKSQVICEDKDLLFEEAPENYKKINKVITDLTQLGLIEVVAVLRPVITYKKKKSCCDED